MASAAAAGPKAFGLDCGVPFPLADIPGAETILLVGANLAERMPPIMQSSRRSAGAEEICLSPTRGSPQPRARRVFICN